MKLGSDAVFFFIINFVQCTFDGISYLHDLNSKNEHHKIPKRDDPCNPLYWYPKEIPAYCYFQKLPNLQRPKATPPPMPIPVPLPTNPIAPPLVIPLQPAPAPVPSMFSLHPMYSPSFIPPPLTFGMHLLTPNPAVVAVDHQSNYFPQNPAFPYSPQRAAMVPGLPGIVTHDGGINILPFSDAYSDLLEKRKQKIMRRKLEKILRDYEDYPRLKRFWRRKRLRNVYFE